ncbi:MAG: carboxypeptidase M32 [Solirubrobacteraceae bacterium]|jgi:carboxypeptidase Taq
MPALEALRARLAELGDLSALGRLGSWDQQVMMPRDGAAARANQLAALDRLTHGLATADEVGEWLDELEADGNELDDLDRDVLRIARRDWDRQRRVPGELVGEQSQAAAEGQVAWRSAREEADFAAFAPALRRNVELAQSYAACFPQTAHPYDALLDDYDFGLRSDRIQTLFARLAEGLTPLIESAPQGADRLAALNIPVKTQQAAVRGTLRRIGVSDAGWRVDVSAHPFSESLSQRDTRITTRYDNRGLDSITGAIHEFGHALYERQIAPELERTNLGGGASMSIHESQSKLWENHVGCSASFAPVIAGELTAAGYALEPDDLFAALTQVRPSLIRVSADQVTYPLHIVLRFELESALIGGELSVEDLPAAWNDGMRRLLGVEVPDDGVGVLQDIHWSAGLFGYFPSYALGTVIAAQLWQQLELDLGSQEDALRRAEVGEIRDWLRERIHRYGRRLDTEPLVEQATGRGIDAEPFLAHAAALVRG